MSDNFGKIAQVIGPVVDVIFEGDQNILPPIFTALKVDRPDGSQLILEVEQHIGEDTVRCVAMESTDGLQRGLRVDSLGRPIAVPTGDQVKGRLLNVLGDAIDNLPQLDCENLRPIHQPAPDFEDLTIGTEILHTAALFEEYLQENRALAAQRINELMSYGMPRRIVPLRCRFCLPRFFLFFSLTANFIQKTINF